MNLPEYLRAHEGAWDRYEKACAVAREELGKSLASARDEFFEQPVRAEMDEFVRPSSQRT